MYDGQSGKKIEAEIFTGVIYYQNCNHMVSRRCTCVPADPVQI
jgi:DNA-directed RNA polymerase subunit B